MISYIKLVKEFHKVFNHPINYFKDFISLKIRQLRVKLIFEELEELGKASDVQLTFYKLCKEVVDNYGKVVDGDNVNKKEELDALCDLQVIISGTINSLGYQDIFDEAFQIVQDSNMSKMCLTEKELEDTLQFYKNKGIETIVDKKENGWIVLRKEDNKILKNLYYKEVDFDHLY